VDAFFSPPPPRGIHATATIDPRAELGDDVYIGPGAYIGECVIGAGSVIHGRAYLYSGTRLGRRVIVHAGAVLGADGFGYQRDENLEFAKFPHLGGVVVEDDVEIGANTCIDRGTLADTLIREGAKIDNLVHIAHNVVIGRHAAVIAHAMIGGSTRIGDYAWVAPCACVRDGLTIGDRATIGLGAVVVKDVAPGETVMGAPARDAAEYKALLARLRELSSSR
jgi:UDP-3-O-[3-hydroxymyristoyl] glucosamine N-acyltransferase